MKKKFISIIMLFAVTFCFVSGCKNDNNNEQTVLVADGKEVIATINKKNYTADDLYNKALTSNDTVEYIYEQLEDLLIKSVIKVTDSVRSRITNEVEKWKKDIKEDATMSGTSYKDALASALENEGVSSEEELIDKKIFAYQEETITNQYWSDYQDKYFEDYLSNTYVYHVSQILVSVGTNGNTDYFNVEPNTNVFKKIYNIINDLSNGKPFYQVALDYSDDSSTASNGGDLGMITLNDSSISNEVKYALASYSKYVENKNVRDVPTYLDTVYGDGIETISFEYVAKLMEEAKDNKKLYEDTTTEYIKELPSTFDNSRVYARNIIFNNLFNSRTFRLLEVPQGENSQEVDYARKPLVDNVGFGDASTANILFNNESDQKHPILVVRSDAGIHFISIKKSAFVGLEELKKYYSTEVDEDDSYKTYVEKAVDSASRQARIEEIEKLAREYAIRATGDNGSFTGNKDFIRYDMFMSYLGGKYQGVKFDIVSGVKELVISYIESQKQYVETKINNYFSENYLKYANNAKHADNPLILKEIPILKCLDDKQCTYSYTNGFAAYVAGGAQ